jgi:hypothetical protein
LIRLTAFLSVPFLAKMALKKDVPLLPKMREEFAPFTQRYSLPSDSRSFTALLISLRLGMPKGTKDFIQRAKEKDGDHIPSSGLSIPRQYLL